MKFHRFNPTAVAACAATALLAACGGSGSDTSNGNGNGSINTAVVAKLTGTAATGAALAGASVEVTNSSKVSPCTEPPKKTETDGTYACTLKPGETAPFFIVVTDPLGNTPPLVSIGTQTPAVGSTAQVNATPLTTAIVAQLYEGGANALGVVEDPALGVVGDPAKHYTASKLFTRQLSVDFLRSVPILCGWKKKTDAS